MLPGDLPFGCANNVVAKKVVVVVLLLWLLCFSLLFIEHGSSWLFQIGGNVGWIAVCLANLLHFLALFGS